MIIHFFGKALILVVLIALPISGWAHCEFSALNEDQTFEATRKWPLHPEITIKARAVLQKVAGSEAETYEDLYNIEIELTSTKDGERIASLCQEGALSSNAIALYGIAIDTAPYVLSKNTHAFGVRASYENNSQINHGSFETISLFGFSEGKIQQLLKTMNSFGHAIDSGSGECGGTFIENKLTIGIAQKSHNGLADLLLTKVEQKGIFTKTVEDCVERAENRNIVKSTLVFNGVEYIEEKSNVPTIK